MLSTMKWALIIILLFVHASDEATDTITLFQTWTPRIKEIEEEITTRLIAPEGRRCACSHFACGKRRNGELMECLHSGHNEDLQCAYNDCGHMAVRCFSVGQCCSNLLFVLCSSA